MMRSGSQSAMKIRLATTLVTENNVPAKGTTALPYKQMDCVPVAAGLWMLPVILGLAS